MLAMSTTDQHLYPLAASNRLHPRLLPAWHRNVQTEQKEAWGASAGSLRVPLTVDL